MADKLPSLTLLRSPLAVINTNAFVFDEVIVDYPETVERLAIGAHVINSPTFENACVKILNREVNLLSSDEVMAVRHLVTDATNSDDFCVGNSILDRALKRKKTEATYCDLRFLLPTSNVCERLFSRVKNAFGDRHQTVLPINCEAQVFLNANSFLWDVHDINTIVNENINEA
ncbi:hypothetical protein AeMF1_010684 [Aphanomyces euteiches]|nr:hypothetical protein AeMF1_010684 [Aphanomyces euteiches]